MGHVVDGPPPTVVESVVDRVHGVDVVDPYRWLEDQESTRTRRWLEEQSAYTRTYFAALPGRAEVRSRVRELLSTPLIAGPWKVGNEYFFPKKLREHEQPVIVVREGISGEEKVLVDPALRTGEKESSVMILAISDDGQYLAYSVRKGGFDHCAIEILDVKAGRVLADSLPDGLYTGFAFSHDSSGFYYAQFDLHEPRARKAAFWHPLGGRRGDDIEIFVAGDEENLLLGILASAEARLVVFAVQAVGRHPLTSIYVQPMEPEVAPRLVIGNVAGCFVPFFAGRDLLAFTDVRAPNFRIVKIDLDDPDPARWHDVVPESDRSIQQLSVAGDVVFVTRTDRFSTHLEAHNLKDGGSEETLVAPQGTIDLLNPTNSTDTLFYSATSIATPPVVYRYSTKVREIALWQESDVPLDPATIAVEETCYRSKDGTSIPLFLAARKDLLHAGPLPTFLTGYGGFGMCVTPRFTAYSTFLIEQGILFAVPALRGGSELGEEWHRSGMGKLRQNAFDDFIAAAEWLLLRQYSAQGRIAIGGGSNAGLLVGAAITQRPDLFRAAICLGPLLDMTRYHLFDLAAGWAEEYGSPEDEQDFHCLLNYSPYHRVRDGVAYPAVLLISGDADSRCNPMHARKMAARLQAANRSENPILLDYKPAWGHTPVQPLSVKIESLTDRLAFVCRELGVAVSRRRSE